MRSKRQRRIDDLRRAIDCLPERTKTAMLDGIAANTIIVGAYTDRRGGVCPMLAAHRHGGRTNLLAFARAWDRFCNAKRPRTATERELTVLKAHLEASMLGYEQGEFGDAIREHQSTARERRAAEAQALGLGWTADAAAPLAPEPEAPARAHELV
jgi:hypothetical protein